MKTDTDPHDATHHLTGPERQAALATLRDWAPVIDRDALTRVYHFASFNEAWGFMSRVALIAAELDHYPEWYNRANHVEITLSTPAVDGLTPLDITLGRRIDALASLRDQPYRQPV